MCHDGAMMVICCCCCWLLDTYALHREELVQFGMRSGLYSDHSVPRWVPPNEPKNPGRAHERARGLGSEAQVRYGTRTKKPGRGPCARGLVSESWSHGGTTSEGCCDVAEAGKAEARHNRPRTWFRPRKPPVVYEWSTM